MMQSPQNPLGNDTEIWGYASQYASCRKFKGGSGIPGPKLV
jgi:hypothetical protein